MADDRSDDNSSDATLKEIERLRADPELQRLVAELHAETGPVVDAAGAPPAPASEHADHAVVAPPSTVAANRSVDDLARVIINRPQPAIERIAAETGIAVEEFAKLSSGDRVARTQVAMRVIQRMEQQWEAMPKTLGGTAQVERPATVEPRPLGIAPRPGRNITGTLVTETPAAATQAALDDDDADDSFTAAPIASPPLTSSPLRWPALGAGVLLAAVAIFLLVSRQTPSATDDADTQPSSAAASATTAAIADNSVTSALSASVPAAATASSAGGGGPASSATVSSPAPTSGKPAPPAPASPKPAAPKPKPKDPFGNLDD